MLNEQKMSSRLARYVVKIPHNTFVFYCKNKQILTLVSTEKRKSIKLFLQLHVDNVKKIIKVSSSPFSSVSNKNKKKLKAIQGTTVALIKQLLIEVSTSVSQKLVFIGMGYRVNNLETFSNDLLTFKLGYSHFIYFRVPTNLIVTCLSKTKLGIFGYSYKDVSQTAALIRSCRTPELYKGKGILYDNEPIVLKERRKI